MSFSFSPDSADASGTESNLWLLSAIDACSEAGSGPPAARSDETGDGGVPSECPSGAAAASETRPKGGGGVMNFFANLKVTDERP